MDDGQVALPLAPETAPPLAPPLPSLPRWFAALQVLLVCGVPTQLLVLVFLFLIGEPLPTDAQIPLELFATLSLLDTALVALLIRLFLILSGETSRDVFLGRRPVFGEAWRGLVLLPVVFVVVTGIVYVLRLVMPWLHNVPQSPLEPYMNTPFNAAIFFFVVIVAGGVREELQRGFILHRFAQRLGGARVGLAIFTIAFGSLHLNQGIDVAIAVGSLGLFWGILYLRRGSVIAAMVNHGSFDAAQVIQQLLVRSL